jgi:hypothetical protein
MVSLGRFPVVLGLVVKPLVSKIYQPGGEGRHFGDDARFS